MFACALPPAGIVGQARSRSGAPMPALVAFLVASCRPASIICESSARLRVVPYVPAVVEVVSLCASAARLAGLVGCDIAAASPPCRSPGREVDRPGSAGSGPAARPRRAWGGEARGARARAPGGDPIAADLGSL